MVHAFNSGILEAEREAGESVSSRSGQLRIHSEILFFFSVLFLFMWACEMTQQVKVLAGNLSMISGTYITNSLKLSSTLHRHTQTQTLKGIRQKEKEADPHTFVYTLHIYKRINEIKIKTSYFIDYQIILQYVFQGVSMFWGLLDNKHSHCHLTTDFIYLFLKFLFLCADLRG